MKRAHAVLLVALAVFAALPAVAGHVAHYEEVSEERGVWWWVFQFHDYAHPVFFILMILSCYFVRFWGNRVIRCEPRTCAFAGQCSKRYRGEHAFSRGHRYFFWGTFLLTFVHIGETTPAFVQWLRAPGMLGPLPLAVLLLEIAYLLAALLYLGGCYHFRYWVGRHAPRLLGRTGWKLAHGVDYLTRAHCWFLILTVVFVTARAVMVVLDTGSLLAALPGLF